MPRLLLFNNMRNHMGEWEQLSIVHLLEAQATMPGTETGTESKRVPVTACCRFLVATI